MFVPTPRAYRIYLAGVYHDTWMQVDEKGTRAAAITTVRGFSIGCSAPMQMPDAVFHANRPFVYFLTHRKTGAILFVGGIADPLK